MAGVLLVAEVTQKLAGLAIQAAKGLAAGKG
jgi:hypothetical protein